MIDITPLTYYQLSNDWDLVFVDNPLLQFRIKSCSLPFLNLSVEAKKTGEKYYSGITHVNEFSIEVYETITFETYKYFKAWQDLIFNPVTMTFNIAPTPDAFDKNATLLFNVGFVPNGVQRFTLEGLKLKGFAPLSLNYETGTALTYTVNMSVKRVI